ncbi:hypothetical protein D3C80_1483510 [compost metagenome]
MLTANRIVIHAWIKFRQFDGDINRRDRISTNQMHFGMIDLLGEMNRLFDQFFIQRIMIILFTGEVHGDQRFTAFWPWLVFDHPHRARTFAQQVPVGRGENHRLQFVVLMGHFE